jgi:hypothetical protein
VKAHPGHATKYASLSTFTINAVRQIASAAIIKKSNKNIIIFGKRKNLQLALRTRELYGIDF